MEVKRVKAKVVMLPTKEKTEVIRNTYCFTEAHGNPLGYTPTFHIKDNLIERGFEYQHLYFPTDEEIKVGDNIVISHNQTKLGIVSKIIVTEFKNKKVKTIITNKGNKLGYKYCKKIIITTDKSLSKGSIMQSGKERLNIKKLPQPSKAFIKKYVEAGGIDEVMVDYITHEIGYCANCNGGSDLSFKCTCKRGQRLIKLINPKLKVNKHNEITIHPIKDSWSREEVINLLKKLNKDSEKYLISDDDGNTFNDLILSNWIKENL